MTPIGSHASRVISVKYFPRLILIGIAAGYTFAAMGADEPPRETLASPPSRLTADVVDVPVHTEHSSDDSHSHADRVKNIIAIRREHEERQLEHERQFRAQVEYAREQVRIHMERRAAQEASSSSASEKGASNSRLKFYGWSGASKP